MLVSVTWFRCSCHDCCDVMGCFFPPAVYLASRPLRSASGESLGHRTQDPIARAQKAVWHSASAATKLHLESIQPVVPRFTSGQICFRPIGWLQVRTSV